MNIKTKFSLNDFEDKKGCGKNWTAKCPRCGKHNLSIEKKSGLYHCFTAGCGFSGIVTEKMKEADFRNPDTVVRMLPTDYKNVGASKMEVMTPLTVEESSNPDVNAVRQYLTGQKIDLQTAVDMRVMCARVRCFGKDDKSGDLGSCIAYVNYIFNEPVNIKYRLTNVKKFSQESPVTPCPPYNIDCLNPLSPDAEETVRRLVIVEGEKDVLTVRMAGYRYVVSVPNGAGSDMEKSFGPFADWLENVEGIVICNDNDLAGRNLRQAAIDYFGARCLTTSYPSGCKDVSEVMQTYGIEAVRELIDDACPVTTSDIVYVGDIADSVVNHLHGDYDHGYDIGMGSLTDHVFHPTSIGGLIIVTGTPNAGKTDILNCMMASLMFKRGKHVCMCSFENPDKTALTAKMVKLAIGQNDLTNYSSDDLAFVIRHLSERLCHLDPLRLSPTPKNILLLADFVRARTTMDYLVVDPYMFVDMQSGNKDTETREVKRMLTEFQSWGRRNHVWVVVVAHPRKLNKLTGSNDYEKIDYYSINGSANWANLGDFIFSVSRIDKKESGVRLRYTVVDMLKVRSQDLCSTGTVLYRRQPCGRYDERPDIDTIIAEEMGEYVAKDTEPWVRPY